MPLLSGLFSSLYKLPQLQKKPAVVPDLPDAGWDPYGELYGTAYDSPQPLDLPPITSRPLPDPYAQFDAPAPAPARSWFEDWQDRVRNPPTTPFAPVARPVTPVTPSAKATTPKLKPRDKKRFGLTDSEKDRRWLSDLDALLNEPDEVPPVSRPATSLPAAIPRGPSGKTYADQNLPLEGPALANETKFRAWAQRYQIQDLDSPTSMYDYRAAYAAGAKPDSKGHWPSEYKKPGHEREVVGGFNTRTGERVIGTPRAKSVDELVAGGWGRQTAAELMRRPEPPEAIAALGILAEKPPAWATPKIPTIVKPTAQEDAAAKAFRLRTPEEQRYIEGAKAITAPYQTQADTHVKTLQGLGAQIAKQKPSIDTDSKALKAESAALDVRAAALKEADAALTARAQVWKASLEGGAPQGNRPSEYLAILKDEDNLKQAVADFNADVQVHRGKSDAFQAQAGGYNSLIQRQQATAAAAQKATVDAKAALQQHTNAFLQQLQTGPRQAFVPPEFPGPQIPTALLEKFQPVAPPPSRDDFRLASEGPMPTTWDRIDPRTGRTIRAPLDAGTKDVLRAFGDEFRAGIALPKQLVTAVTAAYGERISGSMKGHEDEAPLVGPRLVNHVKMLLEGRGAEIQPTDIFGNAPDTVHMPTEAEVLRRAEMGLPDMKPYVRSTAERVTEEVSRRSLNYAYGALFDPVMLASFGVSGLSGQALATAFAADGVRAAIETANDPNATLEDKATAVVVATLQAAPIAMHLSANMTDAAVYALGRQMRAGILAAKLQFPGGVRGLKGTAEAGIHAPAALIEYSTGAEHAPLGAPLPEELQLRNLPDTIRWALNERDLQNLPRNEAKPAAVTLPADMIPGATVRTPTGAEAVIVATEIPTHGTPNVMVRYPDGTVSRYRPDTLAITAPVPVELLSPGAVMGKIEDAYSMGRGAEATALKESLLQRIGQAAASDVEMPARAREALKALSEQHPDDVRFPQLRDAFNLIQTVLPEAPPPRVLGDLPEPPRPSGKPVLPYKRRGVWGGPVDSKQWVVGESYYIQFRGHTFVRHFGDAVPTEIPADMAPPPPEVSAVAPAAEAPAAEVPAPVPPSQPSPEAPSPVMPPIAPPVAPVSETPAPPVAPPVETPAPPAVPVSQPIGEAPAAPTSEVSDEDALAGLVELLGGEPTPPEGPRWRARSPYDIPDNDAADVLPATIKEQTDRRLAIVDLTDQLKTLEPGSPQYEQVNEHLRTTQRLFDDTWETLDTHMEGIDIERLKTDVEENAARKIREATFARQQAEQDEQDRKAKAKKDDAAKPKPAAPAPAPAPSAPTLPRDLAGAAPRYNIGLTSWDPKFESDIDKAAYIIAQKTPSKRDADYLAFVMRATGLDEVGVRTLGATVRRTLKALTESQPKGGTLHIGAIWKPAAKPPAPVAATPAPGAPAAPKAWKDMTDAERAAAILADLGAEAPVVTPPEPAAGEETPEARKARAQETRQREIEKMRERRGDAPQFMGPTAAAADPRQLLNNDTVLLHGAFGPYWAPPEALASVRQLERAPAFVKLTKTIRAVMDDIIAVFPQVDARVTERGILLVGDAIGVHMTRESGTRAILINPLEPFFLRDGVSRTPANVASYLLHAIVHEISHFTAQGDDVRFAYHVAANYRHVGADREIRALRQLMEAYRGRLITRVFGRQPLAPGLEGALRVYREGRSVAGADARAAGDPAYIRGPSRPDERAGEAGGRAEGDRAGAARPAVAAPSADDVLSLVTILRSYEDEGLTDFATVARNFQTDYGPGARGLDQALETAWRHATGERASVADVLGAAAKQPGAPFEVGDVIIYQGGESGTVTAIAPDGRITISVTNKRDLNRQHDVIVDPGQIAHDPLTNVEHDRLSTLLELEEADPDAMTDAQADELEGLRVRLSDVMTTTEEEPPFLPATQDYVLGEDRMDPADIFPDPEEKTVRLPNLDHEKQWEKRKAEGYFMTPAEAATRVEQWKAEALRQGQTEDNSRKVIYSLFDRTGAWSQPFKDAGYIVRTYDIREGQDLMRFFPTGDIADDKAAGLEVVGVLAAPPCTSFAISGTRWWATLHDQENQQHLEKIYGYHASEHFKTPLDYAITLVELTKVFIELAAPSRFHVLENPIGRINTSLELLPTPLYIFHPAHFGDPYAKKTQLWGSFDTDLPTAPVYPTEGSKIAEDYRGDDPIEQLQRSVTPEGFAYAFFMANRHVTEAEQAAAARPTRPLGEAGEPPPVISFRSGNQTSPTDVAGYIKAGQDIGVTALGMSGTVRAALVEHVKHEGAAFIDSGAFGKTTLNDQNRGVSSINFDAVLSLYNALADDVGHDATPGLYVVAPDVAPLKVTGQPPRSFPEETKEVQEQYADEINDLIERGVNVIVPVQVGTQMNLRAVEVLQEFPGAMIGLPGNQAAVSDTALQLILQTIKDADEEPAGFHFLGIGEKNRRRDALVDMVRQAFPQAIVTTDATRSTALFVTGRPAQNELEVRIQQLAALDADDEAVDYDLSVGLAGQFFRGEWDGFTDTELGQVFAAAGVTPAEAQQAQRDGRIDEVFDKASEDRAEADIAVEAGRRGENIADVIEAQARHPVAEALWNIARDRATQKTSVTTGARRDVIAETDRPDRTFTFGAKALYEGKPAIVGSFNPEHPAGPSYEIAVTEDDGRTVHLTVPATALSVAAKPPKSRPVGPFTRVKALVDGDVKGYVIENKDPNNPYFSARVLVRGRIAAEYDTHTVEDANRWLTEKHAEIAERERTSLRATVDPAQYKKLEQYLKAIGYEHVKRRTSDNAIVVRLTRGTRRLKFTRSQGVTRAHNASQAKTSQFADFRRDVKRFTDAVLPPLEPKGATSQPAVSRPTTPPVSVERSPNTYAPKSDRLTKDPEVAKQWAGIKRNLGRAEAALRRVSQALVDRTSIDDKDLSLVRKAVTIYDDFEQFFDRYDMPQIDQWNRWQRVQDDAIHTLDRVNRTGHFVEPGRPLRTEQGETDVEAPAQTEEGAAAPQPEGQAEEDQVARPTYTDGRLIPQSGDKVFQAVRGFGGSQAFIYGEVYEGTGKQKGPRVRMTSSASLLGGGSTSVGKTQQLTPYWTVVGDPEIQRRKDAREQDEKERQEKNAREQAAFEAEARRKAEEAIAGGHTALTRQTPAGSQVVDYYSGDTETLTEQHPEYGPLLGDRTIGHEQLDGTWAGYSVVPMEKPAGGSYKVEVTDGSGFASNAIRYATREEAESAGNDLMSRWMAAKEMRVVKSDDAPTHRWDTTVYRNVPIEATPAATPVTTAPEPEPVATAIENVRKELGRTGVARYNDVTVSLQRDSPDADYRVQVIRNGQRTLLDGHYAKEGNAINAASAELFGADWDTWWAANKPHPRPAESLPVTPTTEVLQKRLAALDEVHQAVIDLYETLQKESRKKGRNQQAIDELNAKQAALSKRLVGIEREQREIRDQLAALEPSTRPLYTAEGVVAYLKTGRIDRLSAAQQTAIENGIESHLRRTGPGGGVVNVSDIPKHGFDRWLDANGVEDDETLRGIIEQAFVLAGLAPSATAKKATSQPATSRPVTPPPAATAAPTTLSAIDKEKAANQAELDQLMAKLRGQLGGPNMGLTTPLRMEVLDTVLKIARIYVKNGILEFQRAALQFRQQFGEDADADRYFEMAWPLAQELAAGKSLKDAVATVRAMTDRPTVAGAVEAYTRGGGDAGRPEGPVGGVAGGRPAGAGEPGPSAGGAGGARPGELEGAQPERPAGAQTGPRTGGERGPTAGVERPGGGTAAPESGAPPTRGGGVHAPGDVEAPHVSNDVDVATARAQAPLHFTITDSTDLTEASWIAKLDNNLTALRLLKELERQGRVATADEQAILAKYIGWGHSNLKPIVDLRPDAAHERSDPRQRAARTELEGLLTSEELRELGESMLNAHYSFAQLPRTIWAIAERLGFTGGAIIEPAVGTGHFFGTMPGAMVANHQTFLFGVDKEPIAAAIAKQLYQGARILTGPLQEQVIPDDYFDVAASNVPFGKLPIFDPAFVSSERSVMARSIHNYYFGKNLDAVRPGGLILFITSRFTMDARTDVVRQYLAKRAKFLGAFRLPDSAFNKTAGTQVVTDVIVLQKREAGDRGPVQQEDGTLVYPTGETAWTASIQRDDLPSVRDAEGNWEAPYVNEYYQAHPEMVLGEQNATGKMNRGSGQYNVQSPGEKPSDRDAYWQANSPAMLAAVVARFPQNVYTPAKEARPKLATTPPADGKQGSYILEGGTVYVYDKGKLLPADLKAGQLDRMLAYLPIRDAYQAVLDVMSAHGSDADLTKAQGVMRKAYNAFVDQFGHVSKPYNTRVIDLDPNGSRILALEVTVSEKDARGRLIVRVLPGEEGLADIFRHRTYNPPQEPGQAASSRDALVQSLAWRGQVDVPYIAALVGKSEAAVLSDLKEELFFDPTQRAWVTKDEYLSGDVVTKLANAEAAVLTNPDLEGNVVALAAVQPTPLAPDEFAAPFGAVWVPVPVYEQFLREAGGDPNLTVRMSNTETRTTFYVDGGGSHEFLPQGFAFAEWAANALNGKLPVITRTERDEDGREREVRDEEATEQARQSLKQLREAWDTWWRSNVEVSDKLTAIYNARANREKDREFDGKHIILPNKSPDVELRWWQKNVIWRAIQAGNTLLAHAVGAGKTYALTGIAGEMKRLNLAHKPMLVVPNHLVRQWRDDFMRMYPTARVLVPTKGDFQKSKRRQLMARIANNNWDAVIVAQSHFVRIAVSVPTLRAFVREQEDQIIRDGAEQMDMSVEDFTTAIAEYAAATRRNRTTLGARGVPRSVRDIVRQVLTLRTRLQKRLDQQDRDSPVIFEQLGVDALLIDEAHLFKNLYFSTSKNDIAGLKGSDSQRAMDMFLKVRLINEASNSRNVHFATGTPVSNTMSEAYTVFRYLAQPAMARLGMSGFDAWANSFAVAVPALEPTADGSYKERTRLREWVNLRELSKLFRRFADVLTPEVMRRELEKSGINFPKLKNDRPTTIAVQPHASMRAFMANIASRIEAIKGGRVDPRHDNHLKISTDATLAAIDMRLVDPNAGDYPGSRIQTAAREIARIYRESTQAKGTQIVFLDVGVPKGKDLKPLSTILGKGVAEAAAVADVEDDTGDEDDEAAKAEVRDIEQETAEEIAALTARALDVPLYEDLKRLLVDKYKIPAHEIAFVQQAKDDFEQSQLFQAVRDGRVRVMLASTSKGATGMNVQTKLVGLHHLDAPWRPADIEQREGRILRQGNTNTIVEILRYVTQGSFDEYRWGLLSTKQQIIYAFLRGELTTLDDADPAQFDMEIAQALGSGDPNVYKMLNLEREMKALRARYTNFERRRQGTLRDKAWAEGAKKRHEAELADLEPLVPEAEQWEQAPTVHVLVEKGRGYDNNRLQNRETPVVYDWKDTEARKQFQQDVVGLLTEGMYVPPTGVTLATAGPFQLRVFPTEKLHIDKNGVMMSDRKIRTFVISVETRPTQVAGAFETKKAPRQIGTTPDHDFETPPDYRRSLDAYLKASKITDMVARTKQFIVTNQENIDKADRTLSAEFKQKDELDMKEAELAHVRSLVGQRKAAGADDDAGGDTEDAGSEAMAHVGTAARPGRTAPSRRGRGGGPLPTHLPAPAGLTGRRGVRWTQIPNAIRSLLKPEGLGPVARGAAGTIRHEEALSYRALVEAREAVRAFAKYVEKLPRADQVRYWDAAERGHLTGDPIVDAGNAVLHQLTEQFSAELVRLDRIKAEALREHYIGRFWSLKPDEVGTFLHRIMSRRPLRGPESFRKARTWDYFTEGLHAIEAAQQRIANQNPRTGDAQIAAIRPATYNWVESQLAKIAEMQRAIAAARELQREDVAGRAKKVQDSLGHKPPTDDNGEAWVRGPDDPALTLYGPKTVTIQEAYDAELMHRLDAWAQALGIRHERKVAIGRGDWGQAQGNDIRTKFGGPETVLMHEIGHVLDRRYGLADWLKDSTIDKELSTLAEERYDVTTATRSQIDYFQKDSERIANLIHAFIYVPEQTKQIAPLAYEKLAALVKANPELQPMVEIQTHGKSLRLEKNLAEVEVAGFPVIGHWYFPKAAAAIWTNHLSTGLRGNPLYDAYMAPAQAATQILLGLSGFHFTTIAREALNSRLAQSVNALANHGLTPDLSAAAMHAIGSVGAAATDAVFGHRIMQEYRRPGTHPELARVLDAMLQGGYRGTAESEFWTGARVENLKQAFKEAVEGESKGRQLWGAAKLPLDALWAGIELQMKPLMGLYVPWMKTAATYRAVADALAKLPSDTSTDDMIATMSDIVKEMDYRYGQVVYDNYFMHRMIKDLAQAVFMAPGWTFGSLGLASRGVRQLAKAPVRAVKAVVGAAGGGRGPAGGRGGPGGTPPTSGTPTPPPELIGGAAAYWIGAVLAFMTINGILTYLYTGKRPQGKDYFAYRDGTLDNDGNPNRHILPGYEMRDIYGWMKHPVQTALNKLKPVIGFMARMAQNRTYFGDLIWNPDADVVTQAKQIGKQAVTDLATPLSFQNYQEAKRRDTNTWGEVARNAFGITPARREFERTPAENKIAEYQSRRGTTARTPERVEQSSARSEYRQALRRGDQKTAGTIASSGALTTRQMDAAREEAKETFLVRGFKALTVGEALRVYEMAEPYERAALWPLLYNKATKLIPDAPEDDRPALERAWQAAQRLSRVRQVPATVH